LVEPGETFTKRDASLEPSTMFRVIGKFRFVDRSRVGKLR
jgi:hypothetical protein